MPHLSITRLLLNLATTGCLCASIGCGFFKELESQDTGGGSEDASQGESGDADMQACDPEDLACLDQDTLLLCDSKDEGQGTIYDCEKECGDELTHVSCIDDNIERIGCWCAQAGSQKQSGCIELEACLARCGADFSGDCGNQCFAQANATTIRTYGAVFSCVQEECFEACQSQDINACSRCQREVRAGARGSCGLEVSNCDRDSADEWPQ